MVLNANFNNISVIPWQAWSVLLVEETGVPGETIDLPQQLQDKNRKFGSCIVIKLIYPCTLHKSNIRLIRSKFIPGDCVCHNIPYGVETVYENTIDCRANDTCGLLFLTGTYRNINRLACIYCTSILC